MITALKELIGDVNKYLQLREGDSEDPSVRLPLVLDVAQYISGILKMFGLGAPSKLGLAQEESGDFEERVTPILDEVLLLLHL